MEQKQEIKQPATKEFIAGKAINLATAFYETPEELFGAIIDTALWLKLSEKEVIKAFNDAIFTVRKTRITIADVLGEIAQTKRKPFYETESEIVG
jgi:phospholipid N-methyltransferase